MLKYFSPSVHVYYDEMWRTIFNILLCKSTLCVLSVFNVLAESTLSVHLMRSSS